MIQRWPVLSITNYDFGTIRIYQISNKHAIKEYFANDEHFSTLLSMLPDFSQGIGAHDFLL
jgi:hypothetical protein